MPRLSKIGAAALAAFGWSSGTSGVTASYLVVAGGGAGGAGIGGGGGAGGYRTGTTSLNPTLSYVVTVGAGGTGGSGNGGKGSNSVLNTITSTGGGGGSGGNATGNTGGSGGGSGYNNTGAAGNEGGYSPVEGYAGGNGPGGSNDAAGGGGGAGGVGSNGSTSGGGTGGNGGIGQTSSLSGSSVNYGGGGGGSGLAGAGTASYGGGNAASSGTGTAGTANTGGGGGGSRTGNGPNGGSGIVIISYAGAQQFGGGVVTSVGGNTIHTFTTSGTLSPITSLSASYLVVAGGGGGGLGYGGGGGAGGLLSGSGFTLDANSIYTITVGAGGAASASGNNSVFISNTAIGGGYGGGIGARSGAAGGSGGGGQGFDGVANGTGGAGTSGQGFAGGTGYTLATIAGGGGGSSAVGAPGTLACGNGGDGTANSITGSSVTYGGGGGGGTFTNQGTQSTGGAGGGGAGGTPSGGAGVAGTANLGGGGGGGSGSGASVGGAGGSGVVIISYAGAPQFGGGTVTSVGGNTIHTFTSSGFLSPIVLLNRSLRFRSSASAYLNRTSGSPTSGSIFTHSFWVKRGTLGANSTLIAGQRPTNFDRIYFQANDTLLYQWNDGTSNLAYVETTQVFRDPAAWYHIVVATDTTQATASNRVKIYVNGVQVTALTSTTYPSQNSTSYFNTNAVTLNIGRSTNATLYLDGYLTEINFVDGQALTPSSFGSFNAYGSWSPVRYGGSYGTNGFYLPFTNNASTTTLGLDFSPNGNNWTTNNISLTAGSTYDSMTDVPTLTSATAANYTTLNPIGVRYGGNPLSIITDGNLKALNNTGSSQEHFGTMVVTSGTYYWEATVQGSPSGQQNYTGVYTTAPETGFAAVMYSANGDRYQGGWLGASWATYTSGDVIGIALNVTTGSATFYKNNTSQGSLTFTAGSPCRMWGLTTTNGSGFCYNFGQRPFAYTPPSGFVALNTYNL